MVCQLGKPHPSVGPKCQSLVGLQIKECHFWEANPLQWCNRSETDRTFTGRNCRKMRVHHCCHSLPNQLLLAAVPPEQSRTKSRISHSVIEELQYADDNAIITHKIFIAYLMLLPGHVCSLVCPWTLKRPRYLTRRLCTAVPPYDNRRQHQPCNCGPDSSKSDINSKVHHCICWDNVAWKLGPACKDQTTGSQGSYFIRCRDLDYTWTYGSTRVWPSKIPGKSPEHLLVREEDWH